MDIVKIENTLVYIAKTLKNANINWALGASLLLYYKGIKTDVKDIDIIVDIQDHHKVEGVLNDFKYLYINSNPKYQTDHFYTIEIGSIDIDIMLNFKVKTKKGLYKYPFKVESYHQINGLQIPLCSLKEWYNAYLAMERTEKVKLIEESGLLD